jgi:16S rRNA C967 or C1407 C5-methylase (RsmB/RsmF family)
MFMFKKFQHVFTSDKLVGADEVQNLVRAFSFGFANSDPSRDERSKDALTKENLDSLTFWYAHSEWYKPKYSRVCSETETSVLLQADRYTAFTMRVYWIPASPSPQSA